MIRLELLGSLDLRDAEGRELHSVLAQPKRIALLACLALSGTGYQRRDLLIAMFWPESDSERARKALRQAIFFLRRSLGQDTILSRGDDEVALNAARISCDVTEFEECLDRDDLAAAVELYRGPLLPGFHVDGVPEFDYLIDTRRARLHRLALEAGDRLIDRLIEQRRRGDALRRARWCVELAPADAGPVGRLLRLLEEDGDRTAALRAWDEYVERLAREYDLGPHPEVRSIVERLREPDAVRPTRSDSAPSVVSADARTYPAGSVSAGMAEASSGTAPSRSRNRSSRGALAGAVVIAVAAGAVLGRDRLLERLGATGLTAGEATEIAVAALPFHVVGDPGISGEGFVHLLSANLEGIEGVRKIDPATVMHAWDATVGNDEAVITPDETLAIASRIDADYAVTGSAVQLGNAVRLTAEVVGRDRPKPRGSVQVDGPADSIAPLIDQLTLELLRNGLIPADTGLHQVSLRGIMTASLDALKAYIEGERKYRRAQYTDAAQDYLRAVALDSSFAQAWDRLARAYAWSATSSDLMVEASRHAAAMADRLPEREAAWLRGSAENSPAAIPIMKSFTTRYPDDVEGWVVLGDKEFHWGGSQLHPNSAFRQPFEKALELSPYNAEAHEHLIEQAFVDLDSTRAHQLITEYETVEPPDGCRYRVGFDLVWGGAAARARAMAVLDTVSFQTPTDDCVKAALGAPPVALDRMARVYEDILDLRERDDFTFVYALWRDLQIRVPRGQIARARDVLSRVHDRLPQIRDAGAYWDLMLHLSLIPDPVTARRAATALEDDPDPTDRFWLGALAIAEGRWPDVERIRTELVTIAASLREADSPAEADWAQAYADVLDAYGALMRGEANRLPDFEDALGRIPQSVPLTHQAPMYLRYSVAKWLIERGEYENAERYFSGFRPYDFFYTSPAELYLGKTAEALGRPDDAAVHYERFLAWWAYADPALQPLAEEAKQALARLSDREGGRSDPPS